jgi:uncharacterized Fe-S center protein
MKNKNLISFLSAVILIVTAFNVTGCLPRKAEAQNITPPREFSTETQIPLINSGKPVVYFTTNITPTGLMAVYKALELEANGNVAVKIHTGEPGNPHFLSPNLIKELVQTVNGTLIETNTVAGSRRASTAMHYQVARDHGFTAIAPVVILDERADISIPVIGGKHLTENIVGARFTEFDFHIVLSHFKGHPMGGFGGAIKNMAIGYASSAGKSWIHSAGRSRTTGWRSNDQNAFLESMAEAAKTIADANKGRILYINVLNHLSVDCDCLSRPAPPTMADIGILASLDPVALDQASVDLVFAAPDGKDLIQRIELRNGTLTLDHAELIGLGSKSYQMITIPRQ